MTITVGNTTAGAATIVALGAVVGLSTLPFDVANVLLGAIWGLAAAAVYVLIVAIISMRRYRIQRTVRRTLSGVLNSEYKRLLTSPKPEDCTCFMGRPDPRCPWHNRKQDF